MSDVQNRRMFLRAAAAASAAWVAADLVQVEEALAYAAQHAPGAAGHGGGDKQTHAVTVLTKEQAAAIDAMTSRILPAVDGRPGAHEAGALYFIDRSLGTFNAGQKAMYVEGVQDLNRRAAEASKAPSFAALAPAQQDAVLREIEQTPFFQTVRFHTIVGTFAVPAWGGNRDYAGWHLVGLEHQAAFQPPFGFYDADANRKG
jgi:gluconate 2-dehydrogenase gamma chain